MGKNLKGGNKTKSQKNNTGIVKKREIPVPETDDDSHVAIVCKVNGDGRYSAQIVDTNGTREKIYPCNLSSGVKKRYCRGIIIGTGTYILISIRDFQKDKADIIFAYKECELGYLVDKKLINQIVSKDTANDNLCNVEFTNFIPEEEEPINVIINGTESISINDI